MRSNKGDNMNLSDKTALVTGAGRGIGQGCALELARAGADVVINDLTDDRLTETAAAIRDLGRQCTPIAADVFSRGGCESLLTAALYTVSSIDILVSNPAWSVRGGFLEYDPDEFEKVIAGTLVAGFHLSQLVARHMATRDAGGKIVFISSVQAEMPMANCAAYGAAKAGLNHMARTMSVELSPHRINVNVIEPGWTDTPGEHKTFGEEVIQREGAKLPWGRLATPADIGMAAAFLSSNAADYITGTVLPVDGGFRFKDCREDELISSQE